MKKIFKIFKIFILSFILCTFLGGCFNYKDINKVLFVTTVLVDVDKENNPIVYCEAFKAVTGGEKGGEDIRIVFQGKGETCFKNIRDISMSSSYKLNYSKNEVIVFTTKAAEYGMNKFTDIFERDQEFGIRSNICIYDGSCKKLLETKLEEEKYIGIYIKQLLENIGVSSRAIEMSFHKYLNQKLVGDKTNVIPIIRLKTDSLGNKITIDGGAVINHNKMIGEIKRDEGQGFNFLMNSVNLGTLEPNNPDVEGSFLTLEILKSKTDTELKYDGDRIKLIKKIKVNTSIGEVQDELTMDKQNIKKIEETAQNNIKKSCRIIFDKYKEKKVDIFDIGEEFYRRYPKKSVKDVIGSTDLILDVDVKIKSSGDNLNFIK